MPDHFKSPRLRLARAKKHIDDLEGEIKRFRQDKNWTPLSEVHPNGRFKEIKLRFVGGSLDNFPLIAADAIHNLRSALDQAGSAVARASGVARPKIGTAMFPFAPTESDVDNAIKGRCNNIPPDIRTLMRALKPYKAGNSLLWAINSIRNIDTHDLLRPNIVGSTWATITIPAGEEASIGFMPRGMMWVAENNELVFALSEVSKPDPNYDLDIVLDIVFDDIEVVGGKPVVRALNAMTGEVERVLMCIERETRRLFPKAFE